MINKEEMLSYIDKSMNTLKDDLKEYIDKSIEENRKSGKFYKKFKSDKAFENKEALYDFDSDEIKLGDVVFGVVCGDDIEDERYPFKVIYKDDDKLILEGIKNIDKWYTFDQACDLRWDIKLMVDGEIHFQKDCTIISKEIIDKYDLSSLLSGWNLGVGFWYWTKTRYECYSSSAWYVSSDGSVDIGGTSGTRGALPHVIIDL